MRAILIDDEALALDYLEKKIKDVSDIYIIGKYTNTKQAYQTVINEQPDIVFLDIEMPEVNGLNLADKILSLYPKTKIVFVTAYNEYAVKAFELNAVDYLLKPINEDRLSKTIGRLMQEQTNENQMLEAINEDDDQPIVCCFKSLHFKRGVHSKEAIDVQWRTSKARELFAYLIHEREQFVRKDVILDLFWPDADIKSGSAQLYTTIYQIRKTLEKIDFPINITSSVNSYKLELNEVGLDFEIMEKELKEIAFITQDISRKYKKLLELYIGDYFEEDDYLWATSEQNRLRILWVTNLKRLADFYINQNNHSEAILIYLQLQDVQPFNEESYFMLMKLYDKFGDRQLVQAQYKSFAKMLDEEYGESPSLEVKEWYEAWLEGRKV